MRGNLFAGFGHFMVLCLILTGCSGQPPVSSQDPVSSDAPIFHSLEGRDYTVSVEKAFPPPDTHTEVLEVPSKAQYACPLDFEEQMRISDSVVRGEVTDITFTCFQGIAWIKADIRITGSLKGSFAENDRVSVFMLGGYIPLQEHIAYYNDGFRFHDMSEEQIEKTVLKETVDGEDFLSIGQDLILCIVPTIDGSPLPEGAYERVSPAGQLTAEENGRFVQRIWDEGTVIRKSYSYEEIEKWIQ